LAFWDLAEAFLKCSMYTNKRLEIVKPYLRKFIFYLNFKSIPLIPPMPLMPPIPSIIGLLFDSPSDYPDVWGPADRFAEFEPESTIQIMEEAITLMGHTPVRIGAPSAMLGSKPKVDLIWNIAEGYGTRNREAWGPTLAEMWGIPILGSDALTLSMSLDKHFTKVVARSLGIPTSDWIVIDSTSRNSNIPNSWYPVFAKPRYEGTAKGIGPWSICKDADELDVVTHRLMVDYNQSVLIEPLLLGAEFTVALIGTPLRALPVLERALHGPSGIGIHAISAHDQTANAHAFTHDTLDPALEATLQAWSLELCREMDVRHFARLDFKCDQHGNPLFLEINPLPTFAGDNTFGILAEIEGMSTPAFLAKYLSDCIYECLGTL
jgi:D-alanine-D-alanine ligase